VLNERRRDGGLVLERSKRAAAAANRSSTPSGAGWSSPAVSAVPSSRTTATRSARLAETVSLALYQVSSRIAARHSSAVPPAESA
jgi:hypothetical protein